MLVAGHVLRLKLHSYWLRRRKAESKLIRLFHW